jgi:hypothetical protein
VTSGSVGATQRKSERSCAITWRHSEPSMISPCTNTTTGPLPPVSSYSIVPLDSSTSGIAHLLTAITD